MNNKGATLFVILLAVVYFIFGMIFYQFLKPDILQARSDLVCSNPSTAGDMATCLVIDSIVPIVIITILATAGGYITDKALK